MFGQLYSRGGTNYELLGTFQCKEETASSYLCLEKVLQWVVKQGAFTATEADHSQLCQIQIRAHYSLTLIQDLNLSGQKNNPPGFSQLAQEMREEEEILQLHESMWTPKDPPPGQEGAHKLGDVCDSSGGSPPQDRGRTSHTHPSSDS